MGLSCLNFHQGEKTNNQTFHLFFRDMKKKDEPHVQQIYLKHQEAKFVQKGHYTLSLL